MGSRPYAVIAYGFEVDQEELGYLDDYDITEAWETAVAEKAGFGKPEYYDSNYATWTDEQKSKYQYIAASARTAVEAAAGPVPWAALYEEPNYVLGIKLARTDWDDALALDNQVKIPEDAAVKIAAACQHFGIEVQPCRLLLLASYG